MDDSPRINRSRFIYILVWIYALAAPLFGRGAQDAIFTFLFPKIHTTMGYLLFSLLSGFLGMNKKLLAFSVLGIAVYFCVTAFAKSDAIKNINSKIFLALKLYCFVVFLLFLGIGIVSAVRVSPTFLYSALALMGLNLWAGYRSMDRIEEKRWSVPWMFVKMAAVNFFLCGLMGYLEKQWLFFSMELIVMTAGNFAASFRARKRGVWGFAAYPAGMLALIFFATLGAVGDFWFSAPKCDAKALASGGAVLTVASALRPYDMIIKPGSNRMYIVYKEGFVTEFDLATHRAVQTVKMPRRGSTQRLVYNSRKDELYTTFWRAEDNGAVAVFKLQPMRLDRIIDIPRCPAIGLALDHSSQSLLVLCEGGDRLMWFDYNSWKNTDAVNFPRTTWPHSVVFDENRRLIYVCSGSMSRYLYEISADTHKITRRAPIGFASLGMALDPTTGKIYIAKPIESQILVLDTFKMQEAGVIRARPGVRDLDIDVPRRRLYAGNYVNGTFQVFDIDKMSPVKEVFVGKQVRGVFHDPESNRDFAATSCGVLEVKWYLVSWILRKTAKI